jgi:nucleotide-binding universal stress UspA family protein
MWGAAVARTTTAEITVLEAFTAREAERPPAQARQIRADLAHQVEAWVNRFDVLPGLRTIAVESDPHALLRKVAGDARADLLVVGSRPFEGITSLGLGSLAHSLAHQIECPLVVVPSVERQLAGGWIIVGIDGSERSRIALRWTESLATQVRARVCAVHRVHELRPLSSVETWRAVESMHARGVKTVELVERTGVGAAELLRSVARERGAALIVVGAKDRHSLGGHLLGAVPDALLHQPPVPVAVLPHAFALNAA